MGGAPPPAVTEEFLGALAGEDFRGPLWRGLSAALAGYGAAVIAARITDRRIFAGLTAAGIRCEPAKAEHHYPGDDDVAALAAETVARALDRLRILLRSGNSPAMLHAYFIGLCLFQFPQVYRRWRAENEPTLLEPGATR